MKVSYISRNILFISFHMSRSLPITCVLLYWSIWIEVNSVSQAISAKYEASGSKIKEIYHIGHRSDGVCPQIIGELVNNFPSCLVSIYNNHHIDLRGTEIPVLHKRFARALLEHDNNNPDTYVDIWYHGKSLNATNFKDVIHQSGLYMKSKWTCSIGVSVCNRHTTGFEVERYPGRENIDDTSPEIPGTMWAGYLEYRLFFPKLKVTLPSLLFVVLEGDMNIDSFRDLGYESIRGTSRIIVTTKTAAGNSGTKISYFGIDMYEETLEKKLIPIRQLITGLTIQEIKNLIYKNPPNKIYIESSPHMTIDEEELYRGKDNNKMAKRIFKLSTMIKDHKIIHYLRPSLVESIDLFVDSILINALTPNISKIIDHGSWYAKHISPKISVQTRETNAQLAFVTSAEEFRFVSCGKPSKSPVNFAVYVSPFDLSTWVLLLTVNFILSVIITVHKRGSVSEGLLRGLVILVEQGDSAVANIKRKPFLYWICGPWILITLIMTNAYKGENITKLLAPYKSIPYENLSQLVNHNFKFLTETTTIRHPHEMHASLTLPYIWFLMSGMNNWDKNYSPQWKKPIQQILSLKVKCYDVPFKRSRQELTSCKKTAYVGWTSETSQLYEIVSLMFPEYKDEKLYIGKEVLFKQNVGWELDNFNEESIYTKLSVLHESGIAMRFSALLLNAKRFHNINIFNATNKFHIKVKGITIKGNIFTVFILVSGLFGSVLLILTTEILLNCFIVRIVPQLVVLMRGCRTEFIQLLRKHKFRW